MNKCEFCLKDLREIKELWILMNDDEWIYYIELMIMFVWNYRLWMVNDVIIVFCGFWILNLNFFGKVCLWLVV